MSGRRAGGDGMNSGRAGGGMNSAANQSDANTRPPADEAIVRIVDYVRDFAPGDAALDDAAVCLRDSIACGLLALAHPACARHLGPWVPGGELSGGARVIGTAFELDPIKAAFDNGALIRWLDFNDTWLAAEWGHPSDNIAAILSVADYLSRSGAAAGAREVTVGEVLAGMVKAHEIQGVLALENSFNQVGLDHVALVKLASTAVVAHLLGGDREQMIAAVSHALVDGQSLRAYRHAPNTGARKSWAAGDAASRAVRLAMLALAGEAAVPTAVSAATWGFSDVLFGGKPLVFARDFGSYVMENILYKVSFPAEFHAQTAVECAFALHPQIVAKVGERADDIARVEIATQESAVRIISKTGPLYNYADRDHCIQYMVAIGLLFGELTAAHYEDSVAADPRIDALRAKMQVREEARYSADYLDADKRAIGNAVQVFFADGSCSERVEVDYPLGHKRRRAEAMPHLQAKFDAAAKAVYGESRAAALAALFADPRALRSLPVPTLTTALTL